LRAINQNFRIQILVAVLSVALLITKLVAYYVTGSVAILTDALESIVNVVAGFFGLFSLYLSAKPKDEDHPYGHGKIEFVSSAVEGSMIFIAGVLIIYEAVKNLIHPGAISQIDTGIILISVTAAVNYVMGIYCVRIGKRNNSVQLVSSGNHLQSDTYSTLGILVGLVLIRLTNISWIDSAVAILFSFIMDETDKDLLKKMVTFLNANRNENWIDLHNLRIIKYGSTLHVDCHLTLPWYLNVQEAHDEVEALTKLVQNNFGESLEIFVHIDPCLDFSCKICNKQNCEPRKHPFKKRIEWTIENISSNEKHKAD
jgi:cation diffusion facilitator family transporter